MMDFITNIKKTLSRKFGSEAETPTGMVLMGNAKTGKALESGAGCPLMKREGKHFTAPYCPSCYAVAILNNYSLVKDVLDQEDHSVMDIVMRAGHLAANSLAGAPVYPGGRLRLYGLTDFRPTNLKAIRMLSQIYKLDIISKTLWHFKACRESLPELGRMKNICISLSFNKDSDLAKLGGFASIEESIEACRAFVRKNKIQKTTSLNYTFTTNYRTSGRSQMEEYRRIPGVRVYHTVSKDKGVLAQAIGDAGVCGLFDESGRRIPVFGQGTKGSCLNCNFCRKGEVA